MKYFERNYTEENLKEVNIKNIERILDRISFKNYTEDEELNNLDLDAKHLEKAFTNKKYYLAMLNVPKKEKEVLYYIVVQNYSLNKTSKIMNLSKTEILRLKKQAIEHFKENLKKSY